MSEHFEALEADFQREYRIDLRKAVYGPKAMGARRMWSLITGLQTDSSLARATGGWTNVEELLAMLTELFVKANFDAKNFKINRPWEKSEAAKPKERKQSTPEEMKRFLGRAVRVDK